MTEFRVNLPDTVFYESFLQLFVFIVGYPSNLIWGTSEISSVVQCLGQLIANYDLKNHNSFIQFPFI